jgi:hypothetical protein
VQAESADLEAAPAVRFPHKGGQALKTVWFHRARAIGWAVAGVVAFVFGWQSSVTFVVIASVYANCVSDWSAAEAADDRTVLDRLDALEALIQER